MTKIIYAVGIHADGGLNILEKFLDRCDNDVIFYLDNRIKIKKKKTIYLLMEVHLIDWFIYLN